MAPEQDWRWILRAADRMRSDARPARDKRARLVSPDRLEKLGLAIMDDAEANVTATAIRRGADYRDGLLIALLARRPFRVSNMAMITGRHLIRQGARWHFGFAASETKNKRPLEAPFPEELQDRLERYLSVHREVLLDVGARHGRAPTDALWISSLGQAAGSAIIQLQITRRTKAAFGKAVNPHASRDSAATWIAIQAPEEAQIIAAILGHTTLATSEKLI